MIQTLLAGMDLSNLSKIPDQDVNELVAWTLAKFPWVVAEGLYVELVAETPWTPRARRKGFSGSTWKLNDKDNTQPWDRRFPLEAKHYILVRVVSIAAEHYPYSYTYRKRAGAMTFQDWREEFVGLLAHELQHVVQSLMSKTARPKWSEVDAERRAMEVLADFREFRLTKGLSTAKVG